MALNLSTLTNPATSGGILAEALTTADFLDPVPILKNLARGSQKGGDAKQTTALSQPRALPLDANGKGYCYLPVTTGNAPAVTFPTIGANDDFVLEMKVYIVNVDDFHVVSGSNNHRILIYSPSGVPSFQYRDGSNNNNAALSGSLSAGLSTLRFEKTGSTLVFKQNGAVKGTINNITAAPTFTHLSFNGQFSTSRLPLNGYIQTCTLSIGGTEQLNIDFTATNVRHNDLKIKCATGQVVTVNKSGNDPATIIKKPVLRFANKSDDSTNISLAGLLNQTVTGGYMFAAFSVLGDGGEDAARVFGINSVGGADTDTSGAVFSIKGGSSNQLRSFFGGAYQTQHELLFDDSLGDILHEQKILNGSQIGKVNNADAEVDSVSTVISAEEFSLGSSHGGSVNPAIDLEYLALFPASITDAQADSVRNYINNRNNVFYRWDTDGYYFFDPQKATFTGNFTNFGGGNILDGYITGSDNGDTDVRSNLTLIQEAENDQPSTDGYTITFNDAAEHLEFKNGVSQNLSGWQIVGTSLGTFAYRVQGAVSEINLLGNVGSVSYRKAGDLYGLMLLPVSASSADIEAAKRLLIDRGAAESYTGSNLYAAWHQRADLVEFKSISMPNVQNLGYTWSSTPLVSFPAMEFPSAQTITATWFDNTSMSDFGAISAPNCTNFSYAWQNCSALTSFPADAKLGTSASSVSFTSAWQSSGLTSFSTPLPKAKSMYRAFKDCTSLTDFSSDVFANWTPSILNSSIFHNTWEGCNLTAQSVENILTSIDSSGKFATSDGTSGGNALGGNRIDIHYDGTTLSAATNAAVTSLKAKGWVIVVNGVTL